MLPHNGLRKILQTILHIVINTPVKVNGVSKDTVGVNIAVLHIGTFDVFVISRMSLSTAEHSHPYTPLPVTAYGAEYCLLRDQGHNMYLNMQK